MINKKEINELSSLTNRLDKEGIMLCLHCKECTAHPSLYKIKDKENNLIYKCPHCDRLWEVTEK